MKIKQKKLYDLTIHDSNAKTPLAMLQTAIDIRQINCFSTKGSCLDLVGSGGTF